MGALTWVLFVGLAALDGPSLRSVEREILGLGLGIGMTLLILPGLWISPADGPPRQVIVRFGQAIAANVPAVLVVGLMVVGMWSGAKAVENPLWLLVVPAATLSVAATGFIVRFAAGMLRGLLWHQRHAAHERSHPGRWGAIPDKVAAEISSFVECWRAQVTYATEPANREAAERAAAAVYRGLGVAAPAMTVWCSSPAELFRARQELSTFLEVVRHAPQLDPGRQAAGWTMVTQRHGAGDPALRSHLRDEIARQAAGWTPRTDTNLDFPNLDAERGFPVPSSRTEVHLASEVRAFSLPFGQIMARQLERDGIISTVTRVQLGAWSGETEGRAAARAFLAEQLKHPIDSWERASIEVSRASGGGFMLDGIMLLMERPAQIHLDERGRLHTDDGPAVIWPEGWRMWALEGRSIPREAVETPDSMSVEFILDETDILTRQLLASRFGAERYRATLMADPRLIQRESPRARRALIDEYGPARFVQAVGEIIARDLDGLGHPRRLWRAERPGDDPMAMVEVINSTPEPDRSYRTYWLRVPPTMRDCQTAVAWTFGINRRQEFVLETET